MAFQGKLRPLIAKLAQDARFILPESLHCTDLSLQTFLKVGPHMGDTRLSQDNFIYCLTYPRPHDLPDFQKYCTEPVLRLQDIDMAVRCLKPLWLLRSKLHLYAYWSRREDWLDTFQIVQILEKGINLQKLDLAYVKKFLLEPPDYLEAPGEWYHQFIKQTQP